MTRAAARVDDLVSSKQISHHTHCQKKKKKHILLKKAKNGFFHFVKLAS